MVQEPDIYILAGLALKNGESWTLRSLADELQVDHTLVHRALKRAEYAGLYLPATRRVHRPNFEELIVHAVRFLAPAKLGELVPGVPAAWAARPISDLVHESSGEPPPVWPSAEGRVRGQALEPLHSAAIDAVATRPSLGELLAAIDSLRAGDLRIRRVSAAVLREILGGNARAETPAQ